jgi:DNA-directed RNA polymerase specialized sigma24 family protein
VPETFLMNGHSISVWLEEIKQGNDEAARRLWERYFPDLVKLARRALAGVPRRMEDEEDVALSALDSFCRAADQGRFPNLNDREGLWRLLSAITQRKAIDLIRRAHAKLGDANVVRLESTVAGGSHAIDQIASTQLSADVALVVAEEFHRLLGLLPDEQIRLIAVAKMEGRANKEIARQIGCAVRTVERRLGYIRVIWREEVTEIT